MYCGNVLPDYHKDLLNETSKIEACIAKDSCKEIKKMNLSTTQLKVLEALDY
jgi:hypothetical protein